MPNDKQKANFGQMLPRNNINRIRVKVVDDTHSKLKKNAWSKQDIKLLLQASIDRHRRRKEKWKKQRFPLLSDPTYDHEKHVTNIQKYINNVRPAKFAPAGVS